MTEADGAPDWSWWRNVTEPKLSEAVGLSLNLDPGRRRPHAWLAGPGGWVFFHESPEFSKRLDLARREIGKSLTAMNWRDNMRGAEPEVNLVKFVEWAASCGWDLPIELRVIARDAGQSARPEGAGVSADAQPDYHTGLAGRPTPWHLIDAECRRRYAEGERHPGKFGESATEWARVLITWFETTHKVAPKMTRKSVTNRLPVLLRELIAVPARNPDIGHPE